MKLHRRTLDNATFWYLASSYTAHPGGHFAAYEQACKQAAFLMQEAGIVVYSPIAHTHSVAHHGGMEKQDHSYWLTIDRPFMEAAEGLIVCQMPGWDDSIGMHFEIGWFHRTGKPIVYMVPRSVPEYFKKGG